MVSMDIYETTAVLNRKSPEGLGLRIGALDALSFQHLLEGIRARLERELTPYL